MACVWRKNFTTPCSSSFIWPAKTHADGSFMSQASSSPSAPSLAPPPERVKGDRVSVDTYVLVPTQTRERAARWLEEEPELSAEGAQMGRDFVAILRPERFHEVKGDPGLWGEQYAKQLPAWVRRGLDARGLLAVPGVGQSFRQLDYATEAAAASCLWLPIKRRRRAREANVLLVALSPQREQRLLASPGLVAQLVATRKTRAIPGSLEVGSRWGELQKALFDYLWMSGLDDPRADAVTPRAAIGMPLYEDNTVLSAKLLRVEQARAIAAWVAELPDDALSRVHEAGNESPAARGFPANLGTTVADDEPPPRRPQRQPKHETGDVARSLAELRGFYREVLAEKKAVLSIRFRE